MKYTENELLVATRLTALEEKIDNLANNHFEHLEKKVDRMLWFILTTLTAVVVHAVGVILHG